MQFLFGNYLKLNFLFFIFGFDVGFAHQQMPILVIICQKLLFVNFPYVYLGDVI